MSRRSQRPLSISGEPLVGTNLMQLVYLDEAGKSNEVQEPYLVVAGVIVNPDQKWRDIENYFMNLSKKCFPGHSGPPIVFHAMHIFHGTHLFDRKKWSFPRRIRLLEKLASVPKDFNLPLVMGYVRRAPVRKWLTENSPNMSAKNALAYMHAAAFFNAIRRVENWMFQNAKNEVAMLIAEDAPEIKDRIRALHRIYTDRSLNMLPVGAFRSNRIVDAVHFAKKDQSLLLQIADHCAFIMKRKLMKRPELNKAFDMLAPQISWTPNSADGIALAVNRSDIEFITQPGSLTLGKSNELIAAFNSVASGTQSGLDKRNLLPHLRIIRAAQDQAFATTQGSAFLDRRPTLRQQLARHQKLSQK
jgi:hypothetical protein